MSLERCPGCRVRLTLEPVCPRCGCDLTLVRRVETQARREVVQAVRAWAGGDHRQAERCARTALGLEDSPLARVVLRCLRPTSRPGR